MSRLTARGRVIYSLNRFFYVSKLIFKLVGLIVLAIYQFSEYWIQRTLNNLSLPALDSAQRDLDIPDESDGWVSILLMLLPDSTRSFLEANCRIALMAEPNKPPSVLITSKTETDFLESNGFPDIELITRQFYQLAGVTQTIVVEPFQILHVFRDTVSDCIVTRASGKVTD